MDDLRYRIRHAREHLGISQEELGAQMGVSRGAVANWESGTNTPDLSNLSKLARVSGLAFEWLATGRGDRLYFGRVPESSIQYAEIDPLLKQIMERIIALPRRKQQALLNLMDSPLFGK